jgi:transposase
VTIHYWLEMLKLSSAIQVSH